MPATFQCSVVTPHAPILDKKVQHASIPAWDGRIGLLPSRAPLLVRLAYGPLRLDLPGNVREEFFIGGGFAQMKDDVLTVLTDEAVKLDQVDRAGTEAALEQAQTRQPQTEHEAAARRRDVERARAMLAALAGRTS